ncbi:MAG: DUF4465 domain-containing protein [Flavobacteriales bacterium]|nr:DUF4465 domain-containing protein [Flavobacteriales bacterium]MCB9174079.1 DUF4465 domain-containing protein [Flavobacteriales bacterium]
MRKIYKHSIILGLGLMLSSTNITAQTADFENLTLPAESYWDGSDLSGTHNNGEFHSEFTSGDFTFPNVFDTTWGAPGYWLGGFAYSNMTDTTTSGVGNKYSAKAGSQIGSPNYVVASNNSSFKSTQGIDILSLEITNSTYAYNSMRDGDAFAKKFGGPTGNDPDWYKINIKTYFQSTLIDSLDFYLADFRFADNSQDYIIKDWRSLWISSSNFNVFDSIYFELSSSDVGMWGMNTPAFFCMDNLNIIITSINELPKDNFSFYPNPTTSVLNIKSVEAIESAKVIDITGKTILTVAGNNQNLMQIGVAELNAGVYFIQLSSKGTTSIQKFIKQ